MTRTSGMNAEPARDIQVFISPKLQQAWNIFVLVVFAATATIVFPVMTWGIFGRVLFPQLGKTLLWDVVLGVMVLAGVALSLVVARTQLRRKLILCEHDFWIGGFSLGRTEPYTSVCLLQVELPEGSVGLAHVLKLTIAPRSTVHFWLRSKDVQACIESLRASCPRAPYIDRWGMAHAPIDDLHELESRGTLQTAFRRKAWAYFVWAGLCVIVSVLGLVMLVFGWPQSLSSFSIWYAVLGGGFGAGLLLTKAKGFLGTSRAAESDGATAPIPVASDASRAYPSSAPDEDTVPSLHHDDDDDDDAYDNGDDNDDTWASDPGRITLSVKRLRRFRGTLGLVVTSIARIFRWSHEEVVREHLWRGDSRAALVMSTTPLLIAAYTDELDCVALLKFPHWVTKAYGLGVGSRLLTVNTYVEEGRLAKDLILGPEHSGNYVDFYPIIADFITGDQQRVEDRKRAIQEAEWARCQLLAAEWLRDPPHEARDGSPYFSMMHA